MYTYHYYCLHQVDPFDPQGCMVELLKARRTGKMFLLQTKDPVFENGELVT
jgi:hypothetical protein